MRDSEKYSQNSVAESLIRVIEAGHRAIVDRIDLGRVDAIDMLAAMLRELAGYGVALVFVLVGWITLQCAAVVWMRPWLGLAGAMAIAAGINLVAGAVVLLVTYSRASPVARRQLEGDTDAASG